MADTADTLDGLEERLKNHSKAFESLLALTPAQEYYGTAVVDGKDPSEQWRAKKQSKAEKRAARRAKLDPANQKSALDVMKEREKKRKRELGMESEDEEVDAGDETADLVASSKRPKLDHTQNFDSAKKPQQKPQKKNDKKKDKLSKQTESRDVVVAEDSQPGDHNNELKADSTLADAADENVEQEELEDVSFAGLGGSDDDEIPLNRGSASDNELQEDDASSAPSSPVIDSPAFDISTNHSTTSSSSSILPPSEPDTAKLDEALVAETDRDNASTSPPHLVTTTQRDPSERTGRTNDKKQPAALRLKTDASDSRTSSPKPIIPDVDQAILQERLRVRIAELRAKRKADGANGQPARSRQELLEQRRKKADQRKAHKKELRRQAKEEEARKQEERLRGSGSPLSGADIFSPRHEANSFGFSKLAFGDGSMADASLSKLVDAPKHKGPQDAKTALIAVENKQKRLAGLDAEKRADIGEKDRWLNASKRAHGERVRDDQSLLKKALKRKEKQKSKSEREWQEREQAVVKGKEMKQKKREDNLAKRRDEKGGPNKKKPVKKGAKKGRPGFEGRFKA